MNSTMVMQQPNALQKLASVNEKTWLTIGMKGPFFHYVCNS